MLSPLNILGSMQAVSDCHVKASIGATVKVQGHCTMLLSKARHCPALCLQQQWSCRVLGGWTRLISSHVFP